MVDERKMFKNDQEGLGWRVPFSIMGSIGWLIFVILWLAFYAGNYSGNQNFAIILASILFVFLLIGSSWALWGLKMIPKEGWKMMKTTGFKWRINISIVLPFAGFIFLIYWFYFQADLFNIYQNIAIFIVTFLVMGGILGVLWSQWKSPKQCFEKQCEEMSKEIGEQIEKSFKGEEKD
jgi:hypothetical protein